MKKCILLIFSMLICSSVSVAQVREFQISLQNNSIIRSVNDKYQLIYTEDAAGDAYFILFEINTLNAKAFKIPENWRIRDMRIWNEVDAYFCGTYNTVGFNGLVGMFDIFSVFAGSGVVNYAISFGYIPYGCVSLHDLKRLDLFKTSGISGDTVNMAMVGTSTFFDPGTTQGTSITSAWFNGVDWRLNVFYNKGYDFIYTDIACLDDFVVAAATDPSGHGCYVRSYHALSDFLYYQCVSSTIYGIDFQSPVGDILITKSSNNTAMVAHYDDTPVVGANTVFHVVTINPFTGIPPTTIPTWITSFIPSEPYGMSWHLMELVVSQGKYPYLLQKADYGTGLFPGMRDWMMRVDLVSSPYIADLWNPFLCVTHSMDLDRVSQQPIVSGEKNYLRTYDVSWLPIITDCANYFLSTISPSSASRESHITDGSFEYRNIGNTVFLPTPIEVEVINICQ